MTALPAPVEPGSDRVRAAGRLAVVPPDAVPPGARVVGLVVLLPATGPPGGLRVVPEELPAETEPADVGEPIRLRPDLALDPVWGHADPRWAGPRTVDVHVARLRRKLGALGSCVETVRGVGYRWVP